MTVVACVKSHVISEMSLQLIEFVHVSSAKHQSGTDRWSVRHRCPHEQNDCRPQKKVFSLCSLRVNPSFSS